ncbi:F-type H+-transporting ATPase subunit gamma [Ruminococcus sp. YE71]|uniref:ATP synthase F1 subunit gamma n=1 Tax=unclassified Ruminococcus TaxID=2608920 RepID=UPI0008917A86|nr:MULTISPECIES: ATP synthase F1 subunit gamma [unclassified Ruminococcus]SDA09413.1 F-type H+-transporting ATPase subunit gamma [Ruminococcus sp. YE78]SFW12322.1 F-type H+-transporting ATPase subunit gamma [Ruminococcus sp. YE71]
MGADIKKLKGRIRSIDSTLHLTKAMGLVASSKIRKANEAMDAAKEYSNGAHAIISRLAAEPACRKNPYLRQPEKSEGGREKLIVIAGDRGLAGGYNAGIFRTLRDYPNKDIAEIIPVGKKSCDRLGDGFMSAETFSYEEAHGLAVRLCEEFVAGEFDRLTIICTEYVSMMSQVPRAVEVFPITADGSAEKSEACIVFEPSEDEVLRSFVPDYITGLIIACVRESFASEVSARRVAMDSAGKNAKQMIDDLQLEYNRARQSMITQEITEIVAGAGAN